MYTIEKSQHGKRLSLFIKGFPKSVILSDKTDQKILKHLYDHGVKTVTKNDNKG